MKSLITFFLCWSLPFLCLGGPIQSRHAAVTKLKAAPGGGGGGGTRWVTDGPFNGTANNYAGYVGHKFTVGASPITVTTLSRWVAAGSSQTHALKIWTDGGSVVATASLNAASFSNAWGDVTLGAPVVLSASTAYRIGSEEFSGGDTWHQGSGTPYTTTAVATGNAYSYGTTYPDTDSGSGPFIYGPVSFSYSSP